MARGVEDFFTQHGGVQAPSLAEIAESVQEAEDHKWRPDGNVYLWATSPLHTATNTQIVTPGVTYTWESIYVSFHISDEYLMMEFMRQRNARNG